MADRQGRQLRLILIYFVLAAPLVFYGAARSLQSNANSPIDWVPSTFPPRAAYDAFCAAFGPGDAVVASWEGCTLDEPKLDGLTRALRESPSFREGDDWLFEQVISGRELAGVLTGGPAPISPDESVQRLRGTLVGPDGRTTCVIITFTPAGLKQRERLVSRIQDEILKTCGIPHMRVDRRSRCLGVPTIPERYRCRFAGRLWPSFGNLAFFGVPPPNAPSS